MLDDPLVRLFQAGDELLGADDEDDVGGAPGVGGELAAGGRGDDERSLAGDRVDAAERVVRLAGDRLHLRQLGREVERHHLVARRVVRSAAVDRVGDAGLLQRHRGVGHHRGAFGDAGEDGFARGVQVVDDLDAESVLLERDDGVRERLLVGQCGEAVGCMGRAHC